jgi:hypothetical protein
LFDAELHTTWNSVSEGFQEFEGFCFEYTVGLFVAAVLGERVELFRRLFEFFPFLIIRSDKGKDDHIDEFNDLNIGELFTVYCDVVMIDRDEAYCKIFRVGLFEFFYVLSEEEEGDCYFG